MSTEGSFHQEPASERARNIQISAFCAHCHKPNPGITLRSQSEKWFCCSGCKTVYELLCQSGLSEFYRLKQDGYCVRQPSPAVIRDEQYQAWDQIERRYSLYLEGVHCTACLWLIEKLPTLISDVRVARLDLGRSLLQLELSKDGKLSRVATLLNSWGYRPHLVSDNDQLFELQKKNSRRTLIELGVAGALAGNVMLMSIPLYAGVQGSAAKMFEWICALLSIPSLFYSGRGFFKNVFYSFKKKTFSIDTPILAALLVAFFFSFGNLLVGKHDIYFDSLTTLVFLLLSSRYLLQRLRQYGLGDASSLSLLNGDANLKRGELVSPKPDELLAFDGLIKEGKGYFDQSVITGESFPVLLKEGDLVFAGSRFAGVGEGHSSIHLEVLFLGCETRIQKMIEEVKKTQSTKSLFERRYDQWAKYLLMCVLFLAFDALIYFTSQHEVKEGVLRVLALLIVTCPCALALATPLTLSLALKSAYLKGLVVKNVDALENSSEIKNIVFDKTGTLTFGRMEVVQFEIPFESKPKLRALVQRSMHPVSRAVFALIGSGVSETIDDYQEIPGVGISGKIGNDVWSLVRNNRSSFSELSSVSFMKNSEVVGMIYLSDRLRDEAPKVLSQLQAMSYRGYILSGDQEGVVLQTARVLGIESECALSGQMPEDKGRVVAELAKTYPTLMVGDGVNDALALSNATVSLAVQGGLEAALKSSDVYSLKPGISSVLELLTLSKQVKQVLFRNFVFSTSYNAISAVLALSGYMSPLIAAVLMPLSAITVFSATAFSFRPSRSARSAS